MTDDTPLGNFIQPPAPKKRGRPRKERTEPEPPKRQYNRKQKITPEGVLAEIEKVREQNPGKSNKEIHDIYLESKRDLIIAWLFDTAANGDTVTARLNARQRLKDELDGRVATQERKIDEDKAIGRLNIPEEM